MRFNKTVLLVAIAGVATDAFAPSHRPGRSLSFAPPVIRTTSSTSLEGVRSTLKRVAKAIKTPPPETITEGDVRRLFFLWNDALATGDSAKVANLYAKDGFLLPTVSDVPRTDFDSIKDYFDNFLQLEPQGVILEGHIKIGKNWAKDVGIYEFTMGKDGSKVKARYSFIYAYEDGEWKISHHHSSAMPEASRGEELSKDEVRNLFGLWNDALATLDPDKVVERYSKSPVLLPTVSDDPRTDYDSIKDYFVNFLKLEPQGTILESHVTTGPNWAKDAGVYEFEMGATGEMVKARYSFVYVYENGEWKIAHHHSSQMPESSTSGKQQLTKEETKGLFNLWNDALATLDSDAVAMRYSKKAVLLPTVSDTPRTDYDSIKDYFDNFLKLKPQGKILESHQTCGDGWCKDVGVYEFTMGADNSKVKARYSFVYVFEDGEWKISHHHSSAMPEESKGIEGKVISDEEVRSLFGLWNDALATLEPEKVAARYSKSPVLLPTVSDEPRTDFDGIKDYFVNFLKLKPQGTILESHVTKGPNWAKDAGIYEFNMGSTGDKVKARYSFVYVYEDGEWKIAHHHSSQMPESGAASKEEIADTEVKGLFHLWNDALATLDSDAVAMRYAKNAVLLPTVSDTPRADYDSIKDYFDNFLELKPQGKILESYTEVGDNWCKDVGIYEFTMGKDGSKVKARYSFVYVFEDGEWKISHHHSSAMPEESKGVKGEQLSKGEVRSLFGLWNDALATLDPEKVAERYSKTPVLLPTVSDEPRTDFDGLKDYFANFLKLKPQGTILQSHVTTGPNWAKDAGIYEFKMGSTGDKVKARYSFVYVYEDGEWKIAHHHSSQMPESGASGKEQITEKEVESLFDLWNDALATLDSDAVAMRYAKKAVLLPTVSDTPRTDYDSIKDYFDTFLQKQPQGKILERYTLVGDDWCKDVGIYEFKMGADGSKVKARYSFVYVFEDGEWKISHHHSSAMPEPMLEAASQVEKLKSFLSV